jgi:hypothetical protein
VALAKANHARLTLRPPMPGVCINMVRSAIIRSSMRGLVTEVLHYATRASECKNPLGLSGAPCQAGAKISRLTPCAGTAGSTNSPCAIFVSCFQMLRTENLAADGSPSTAQLAVIGAT